VPLRCRRTRFWDWPWRSWVESVGRVTARELPGPGVSRALDAPQPDPLQAMTIATSKLSTRCLVSSTLRCSCKPYERARGATCSGPIVRAGIAAARGNVFQQAAAGMSPWLDRDRCSDQFMSSSAFTVDTVEAISRSAWGLAPCSSVVLNSTGDFDESASRRVSACGCGPDRRAGRE